MGLDRFSLMKEYTISQTVRGRNFGGLLTWSSDNTAQPTPPSPTDDWIRLRLLAERVPQAADTYTQRVAPFMIQVPEIIDNMCEQMAPFLMDTEASAVQQQIANALQVVMPQLAAAEITQSMVDQWKTDHGFPVTARSVAATPTF